MDEGPIQDALIVRMVAELMKGLATASETEAGEGEKVSFAANPDAFSVSEQGGLLGNEPPAALQETGEPANPVSPVSATTSAAEPEVKRPAIFGDQSKSEIIEQAFGLATETQQPTSPAVVSVAKPDIKNEPQPDITFPEPQAVLAAPPASSPDIGRVVATAPPPVEPQPFPSIIENGSASVTPELSGTNPIVTFEPQQVETPKITTAESDVKQTLAVTFPEPPPAFVAQSTNPLDTGGAVIDANSQAKLQPLIPAAENAPAVVNPEPIVFEPSQPAVAPQTSPSDISSLFTFGQQPAKSPEPAAIENAPTLTPTPNVTPFELLPALATRPPDAPAAEEIVTASPPVESQHLAPILENKPAVASPDSDSASPVVTFKPKQAESQQSPTFENAAPPTPNVTIPEPQAPAARPPDAPAAEEIVTATSPPARSQPFALDTEDAPIARPEGYPSTEAIFTFGQQQAESSLSQVPESIAVFGHPARPPSAEAIVVPSPTTSPASVAASPSTVQAPATPTPPTTTAPPHSPAPVVQLPAVNVGKPKGVDSVVNSPAGEPVTPPSAAVSPDNVAAPGPPPAASPTSIIAPSTTAETPPPLDTTSQPPAPVAPPVQPPAVSENKLDSSDSAEVLKPDVGSQSAKTPPAVANIAAPGPQPAVSPAPVKPPEPPQPAVASVGESQTPSSPSQTSNEYSLSRRFDYDWSRAAEEELPAVLEGQPAPGISSDALESGPEPQTAETPPPIAVNDGDTQKPQSLSSLPDFDLGTRFDDTHEWPLAIEYQAHQRFLEENAEVIESLRSTPRQFWTPEQRQQAKQIRKTKEAYKSLVLDVTQGPVQGPQPPPPPSPPAFGSERPIETESLFAVPRPAAASTPFWHEAGVRIGGAAEQARLQRIQSATAPAEFVADWTEPPPESPPQVALATIPEKYRGNLASDALSEAAQFEQIGATAAPESGLPVHGPEEASVEAVPTSMWTKMARRAKQAFQQTFHPPTTPFATQPRRLDPASFSEGTRDQPRSVFDQPDEEEPLSSPPDDDDFWSALPPVATGAQRRRGRAGRGGIAGGIFDALTGGQGGSQGGAGGGSRDVMHVWVDGGQLQLVDHINSLGAVTGKHLQSAQTSPASPVSPTGPTDDAAGDQNETSNALLSLLGIGGAAGPAAIVAAATYAGSRADQAVRGGIHSTTENASPFIGQTQSKIAGDAAEFGYDLANNSSPASLATRPDKVLATMASLPRHVTDWTEALLHSTEGLRQFSGTIGTMFAQAQVREITRGIQSAQATGGNLSEMSTAYQDLLDEVRPIKDALTNTISTVLAGLLWDIKEIVRYAKYLEYLPGIAPLVAIAKALEGKQQKDQTFFDAFARSWQTGEFSYRSTKPGPMAP